METVTKEDLMKYLGIRITMALEGGRGDIASYWNVEDKERSVKKARKYGERFKMSRQRFQAITSNLRLDEFDEESLKNVRISHIYYLDEDISHFYCV